MDCLQLLVADAFENKLHSSTVNTFITLKYWLIYCYWIYIIPKYWYCYQTKKKSNINQAFFFFQKCFLQHDAPYKKLNTHNHITVIALLIQRGIHIDNTHSLQTHTPSRPQKWLHELTQWGNESSSSLDLNTTGPFCPFVYASASPLLSPPLHPYIPAEMRAKVQLVSSGSASSSPHHHSGLQSERKLARSSRPISSRLVKCAQTREDKGNTVIYCSMHTHEGIHVKACKHATHAHVAYSHTLTHTHTQTGKTDCWVGELCTQ